MEELQREQQQQLLDFVGLSKNKFSLYGDQTGPIREQLLNSSDVSLEDFKRSLEIKTKYLQTNGQELLQILIKLSATLTLQQKQHFPNFLEIFISDEAFQNDPSLDKQQFKLAVQFCKNELVEERAKLQELLMQFKRKFQTAQSGSKKKSKHK